jgi:hypothetical protein
MSPNPLKNTFSTNHVQTLEAAVNHALKEFDKYNETSTTKQLRQRAAELLKGLGELKQQAGKLQLEGPEFTKAKNAVAQFDKEARSAVIDLANAITPEHCHALENMVQQVKDAVAKAKAGESEEGKKLLEEAEIITKRINNLKLAVGKIPETDKSYVETKTLAGKLVNETKTVLAELAKKPKQVFKFSGAEVEDEAALIDKIKSKLPSNGHGNIKTAMQDLTGGKGKATTGHSGVLHASAGVIGKNAGGCTLFFKRSGVEIDVVGVGQHQKGPKGSDTSYTIHHGQSLLGKTLTL